VPYPDINTKEKAQMFVGLDAKKMEAEKEAFKTKLLPEWKKLAAERDAKYPTYN
jgi:nitrite reductase (cytochrome c-552)